MSILKIDENIPSVIYQMDADFREVERAQQLAEIKNQAKRHAERMGHITDWSKPENITARIKKHEEDAVDALARAMRMKEELGIVEEDVVIPDPLPARFKGQQPSTIKALLRHEKRLKGE